MKRKKLLSRTFLALVLTTVCININAQGKINSLKALKKKPKIGGIVGLTGVRTINGIDKSSEAGTQLNNNGLMDNVIKFTPIITPLPHVPDFSKTNFKKNILPKLQIDKNRAYLLSLNLIQKGDTINGIKFLKMAVDEGLNNAQYLYGRYCIEGRYVKKNIPLGISYIQKAAKQNNVEALAYLGDAYYLGLQGFKKDSANRSVGTKKVLKEDFLMHSIVLATSISTPTTLQARLIIGRCLSTTKRLKNQN